MASCLIYVQHKTTSQWVCRCANWGRWVSSVTSFFFSTFLWVSAQEMFTNWNVFWLSVTTSTTAQLLGTGHGMRGDIQNKSKVGQRFDFWFLSSRRRIRGIQGKQTSLSQRRWTAEIETCGGGNESWITNLLLLIFLMSLTYDILYTRKNENLFFKNSRIPGGDLLFL